MAVDHTSSPQYTSTRDHFRALELHYDADADEIRSAYFRLVLTNHPDRNQGDANAAARFKKVQRAYEVLSRRNTLTRTEHLLRTPFMSDSFGVPSSSCEGVDESTFEFNNHTRRRGSDARRVGQWLAVATVATTIVVMLGLSRGKSLIATAPADDFTQIGDAALPTVSQKQIDTGIQMRIGPTPAALPGDQALRSTTNGAESSSQVGDPDLLAEKEIENAWESVLPASLLALRDRLISALDVRIVPRGMVGRLLDLCYVQAAVDDVRSFEAVSEESDSRALISSVSQEPEIPNSRGDATDVYPGLAPSRRHVPISTRSQLSESAYDSYESYGSRNQSIGDYRWQVDRGSLYLDRGHLDRGFLDRGYLDQGYLDQGYRDLDSSREDYGQSFDQANDDLLSLPTGRVPPSWQLPPYRQSEFAPTYKEISSAANRLPPLPEPVARDSMLPPPHVSTMQSGARQSGTMHAGDAQQRFSSTRRVMPGGQFDDARPKWSAGLPDTGWRNRPTRDRRASLPHDQSTRPVLTAGGRGTPSNSLSPYTPSYEYRPNPQAVYSTNSPDRDLLSPRSTLPPVVRGDYLSGQWREPRH